MMPIAALAPVERDEEEDGVGDGLEEIAPELPVAVGVEVDCVLDVVAVDAD